MKKFFSTLFTLIILASFVVGIHAGIKYGTPYVHYKLFKSSVEKLMTYKFNDMKDFRTRLLQKAKDNKINLSVKEDLAEPHGLFIYSDAPNKYNAKMSWEVYVDYFGYYPKTFVYQVEVSN